MKQKKNIFFFEQMASLYVRIPIPEFCNLSFRPNDGSGAIHGSKMYSEKFFVTSFVAMQSRRESIVSSPRIHIHNADV